MIFLHVHIYDIFKYSVITIFIVKELESLRIVSLTYLIWTSRLRKNELPALSLLYVSCPF